MSDSDNARYAAKIKGRVNGTAPVFTTEPAAPKGNSPDAVSERHKAKIAARNKPPVAAPVEPVVAAKPAEAKPEPKADKFDKR